MTLGIYLQQDDDPAFTVQTTSYEVRLSCDGCGWSTGFLSRPLFDVVKQAAEHSRTHHPQPKLTANNGGQR